MITKHKQPLTSNGTIKNKRKLTGIKCSKQPLQKNQTLHLSKEMIASLKRQYNSLNKITLAQKKAKRVLKSIEKYEKFINKCTLGIKNHQEVVDRLQNSLRKLTEISKKTDQLTKINEQNVNRILKEKGVKPLVDTDTIIVLLDEIGVKTVSQLNELDKETIESISCTRPKIITEFFEPGSSTVGRTQYSPPNVTKYERNKRFNVVKDII